MIAAKYNPNADSEQKREVLECGLAVGDASPAELYENAMWLDQGHVGGSLRREFVIRYLLRSAHFNYISALPALGYFYEVGKHGSENAKKAHCFRFTRIARHSRLCSSKADRETPTVTPVRGPLL